MDCPGHLQRGDVRAALDRFGQLAGGLIRHVDALERRGLGFQALNGASGATTSAGRAILQPQATMPG